MEHKGAWWYRIAVPKEETTSDQYMGEWSTGLEWFDLPKDVYDHKEYPTCPQCKSKFVPIGHYKRCFKCRFTS